MNRQQRRTPPKQSAKQAAKTPSAKTPSAETPGAKTESASRGDTPATYFKAGLRLLQAGQLVEAEQCGQQALAIDAGHADSLHLMGLLCFASKQFDLAIEWFDGQGDERRSLTLRRLRERARMELGQPALVTLEALKVLDAEARRLGFDHESVAVLLIAFPALLLT